MKGLIIKDLYMLAKMCKSIIFVDIIFVAASFFGDGNMFFIFYPCLTSGVIPMTLISYDEKEKWDKYAGTLPYTRAQIVSSKYIIGLLVNMVVLLLIAAVQAFRMYSGGQFILEEYFAVIITLLSLSLIAHTVLLPLVFKFGSEKGRIFYYIVICMAFVGSNTMAKMNTSSAANVNGMLVMSAVCVLSWLIYAASWLLSVRFYSAREL